MSLRSTKCCGNLPARVSICLHASHPSSLRISVPRAVAIQEKQFHSVLDTESIWSSINFSFFFLVHVRISLSLLMASPLVSCFSEYTNSALSKHLTYFADLVVFPLCSLILLSRLLVCPTYKVLEEVLRMYTKYSTYKNICN